MSYKRNVLFFKKAGRFLPYRWVRLQAVIGCCPPVLFRWVDIFFVNYSKLECFHPAISAMESIYLARQLLLFSSNRLKKSIDKESTEQLRCAIYAIFTTSTWQFFATMFKYRCRYAKASIPFAVPKAGNPYTKHAIVGYWNDFFIIIVWAFAFIISGCCASQGIRPAGEVFSPHTKYSVEIVSKLHTSLVPTWVFSLLSPRYLYHPAHVLVECNVAW